ncbi:MAG: hypothetical protein QG669_496 [Patescibacteria group bacterium]|nr:hypothetical protein [Patescibacteria group bacterium]
MKKIPQTITGRVFGVVFLVAMVFGNAFTPTKFAVAQVPQISISGTSPTPGDTAGTFVWPLQISTQGLNPGDLVALSITKDGGAFILENLTLPPAPQVQNVSYSALNLTPGSTYVAQAQSGLTSSNPVTIVIPGTGTPSQANPSTGTPPSTPAPANQEIPKCWISWTEGFSVMGCGAQVIYYLIFVPTSFILALSGQFMDFLLGYTLDSGSYSIGNFVGQGWKLVRDLTNILFIFILVSIGIGTIIGNSKLGDKKLIGWVIIVALLINFSLFFTKVIIDAGNILGTVFYSAMGVKGSDTTSAVTNNSLFDGSEKSISVAIVSKFNPQTMFANADKYRMQVPSITGEREVIDTGTPPGWFIVLTIILSVVNVVTAYAFFVVGLLFAGRVVGLWIAMILSPLAFMSLAVPSYMSFLFSEYKFSSWAEKVAKLSFSAPVFLFFLYVILSFLNQGFLEQALNVTSDMTTMEKFLSTLVPFVIITMLILKAKDVTVKMSDEIGKKFASWGESLGSLAVGGALAIGTGGAALAMRGTMGRGAAALSRSQTLQTAKGKTGVTGMMARLALRGTDKLSKASFDARNTMAADALKSSPLKIDLKRNVIGNAVIGADGKNRGIFGKTEGGYTGLETRKQEDIEKEARGRLMDGDASKAQDKRAKEYKEKLEAEEGKHSQYQEFMIRSNQGEYNNAKQFAIQQKTLIDPNFNPADLDENEVKQEFLRTKGVATMDEFKKSYKESYENGVAKELELIKDANGVVQGSTYTNKNVAKGSVENSGQINKQRLDDFTEDVKKGNTGVAGAFKSSLQNSTIPGGATLASGINALTRSASDKRAQENAAASIGKKYDVSKLQSELGEISEDITRLENILKNEVKILDSDTPEQRKVKYSQFRIEKQTALANAKAEETRARNAYQNNPTDTTLLKDYTVAMVKKEEAQDNLNEAKNLSENIEKKKERRDKIGETIKGKLNTEKKDDKK